MNHIQEKAVSIISLIFVAFALVALFYFPAPNKQAKHWRLSQPNKQFAQNR